jgi:hypothetical protein
VEACQGWYNQRIMAGPEKLFNKMIVPHGGKGQFGVVSKDGGDAREFKNPVKEKVPDPQLLNNLAALIMEAFPREFQGTEGEAREHELVTLITKKYPEEQPMEAAERTLPTLVGDGMDMDTIADAIMTASPAVRTALHLDSMSKADQNKKIEDLKESMRKHWLTSGYRK